MAADGGESVDSVHLLVGEVEIEVGVVLQIFLRTGRHDRNETLVQQVAQGDLSWGDDQRGILDGQKCVRRDAGYAVERILRDKVARGRWVCAERARKRLGTRGRKRLGTRQRLCGTGSLIARNGLERRVACKMSIGLRRS